MTTATLLPTIGVSLRSPSVELYPSRPIRRRGAKMVSSSRRWPDQRPEQRPETIPSWTLLAVGLAAAVGALVATLVLALFGLLAYASNPTGETEEASTSVYRQALPGVVSVVDRGRKGVDGRDFVLGSGFFVDLDGRVLTNHHVIENVRDVGVALADGSAYQADFVGDDPAHDLALLKVEIPRDQVHPLRLGDSSRLQVGQQVVAIGSPYGLRDSASSGIVSYLGRRVEVSGKLAIENAIQTDAALNPGNWGGPLLDTKGEVIGVNTRAMLGEVGDHEHGSVGVGFAIPANAARGLLSELIGGRLRTKPWLGITAKDSEAGAEAEGAKVVLVLAGSPADEARLEGARSLVVREDGTLGESGDVITAVDGMRIRSARDLAAYLAESGVQVGSVVRLNIVRAGEELEVFVRLGARDTRQTEAM